MEKQQITYIILFISAILILLTLFLLFVLIWYRTRRNRHIRERGLMQATFKQEILQSRLEMQEQTFNSISQEIHDNVGQLLSLAKVQLSIAEQNNQTDKGLMTDIKNNISSALNDLRDIAKSLSTERIQQLAISQAIAQQLQRINRLGFIKCLSKTDGEERYIDEQKKLILFRIIQEILQNIIKHAAASQIETLVKYNVESIEISITDNGLGFNTNKVESKGLGLQNMISRAKLIHAQLNIHSQLHQGTTITIKLPYE